MEYQDCLKVLCLREKIIRAWRIQIGNHSLSLSKLNKNRIVPVGYLTNSHFVDDLKVVEMDVNDHSTPPKLEDESSKVPSEVSFNFNDSLNIYLAKPINESHIFTVESSKDSNKVDEEVLNGEKHKTT